jgi:hypothetical protein
MSMTDTITTVEDRVFDVLQKVQKPVVDVLGKLSEKVADRLPENRPQSPLAGRIAPSADVIDAGYGFFRHLVENQHAFTKDLYHAVSPLRASAPSAPAKKSSPKVVAA